MANLKYYLQIKDLQNILNTINLNIPRLRGLQLMVEENTYEKEQIEKLIQEETARAVQDLIQNKWNTDAFDISLKTEKNVSIILHITKMKVIPTLTVFVGIDFMEKSVSLQNSLLNKLKKRSLIIRQYLINMSVEMIFYVFMLV